MVQLHQSCTVCYPNPTLLFQDDVFTEFLSSLPALKIIIWLVARSPLSQVLLISLMPERGRHDSWSAIMAPQPAGKHNRQNHMEIHMCNYLLNQLCYYYSFDNYHQVVLPFCLCSNNSSDLWKGKLSHPNFQAHPRCLFWDSWERKKN